MKSARLVRRAASDVPALLGGGTRLFDRLGPAELEITRVIASPSVTHIRLTAAG